MPQADEIKQDLRVFYASEAADRESEAWLLAGGSARVPESRSSWYFIDRKVATALALTELPRESRVLEIGCSFGHMTFLLARHFREVVAVDLSQESLALAARRAEHYGVRNVTFRQADAESLVDIADRSFDGAFMFSTLRFCPQPERALAEMYRTLRRGGRAAVDVPNRNCPWYGPLKRAIGVDPHIHDRLYDAREIAAGLSEAGFRGVRTRHILFTTKRVPDPVLPAFRVMDAVLERVPGVRSWSGVVMAAGSRDADR
jgi:SAM-dependent methyltransferase